ncbi:hypothetical protein FHG87_003105 [Trinorchestia longiramus]|nr:hypothetical protein FHG87_003105 [Trinorchestia longiramus]
MCQFCTFNFGRARVLQYPVSDASLVLQYPVSDASLVLQYPVSDASLVLQMLRDLRQGLLRRGGADHPSHRGCATAVFYAPNPHGGEGGGVYANEVGDDRGDLRGDRVNGEREAAAVAGLPLHWYDEPPYESDPEDFLIGNVDCTSAEEESNRSLRDSLREEDVISLRTAGDISLPRSTLECVPLLGGAAAYHALASDGSPVTYYQQGPYQFKVYDDRGLDPSHHQHREQLIDSYREQWPGGGSLREPKVKHKVEKRDKDKAHKMDKENDKYYCKNNSKKSSSKHRSLRGQSHSSRSTRPSCSSIGDCSVSPKLLMRMPKQPVYDNISGSCLAKTGKAFLAQPSLTNGLPSGSGSSCSASVPHTSSHQYTDGAAGWPHGTPQPPVPHYRTYQPQQPQLHYPSHYYYPTQGAGGETCSTINGSSASAAPLMCGAEVRGPVQPSRHNLQLRGLSSSQSHYLHMHGQQQSVRNASDHGMVVSTSPDYQLRWDLHNVTAVSGPSRLSAASIDSHRSDPSELCFSNLMVSDGSALLRCSARCNADAANAGLLRAPPGTVLLPSSANGITSYGQRSVVREVPLLCCNNSATSCCCCLNATSNASGVLSQKMTDPLTLGELRGSRRSLSNYVNHPLWQTSFQSTSAVGKLIPSPPLSSKMLVPPARPQSLLTVCSTTDCHLDMRKSMCPVQSLADLTIGSNDACCSSAFSGCLKAQQQSCLMTGAKAGSGYSAMSSNLFHLKNPHALIKATPPEGISTIISSSSDKDISVSSSTNVCKKIESNGDNNNASLACAGQTPISNTVTQAVAVIATSPQAVTSSSIAVTSPKLDYIDVCSSVAVSNLATSTTGIDISNSDQMPPTSKPSISVASLTSTLEETPAHVV